jgi:hypothetical protein
MATLVTKLWINRDPAPLPRNVKGESRTTTTTTTATTTTTRHRYCQTLEAGVATPPNTPGGVEDAVAWVDITRPSRPTLNGKFDSGGRGPLDLCRRSRGKTQLRLPVDTRFSVADGV